MAEKRTLQITELTRDNTPSPGDYIPAQGEDGTKAFEFSDLRDAINDNLNSKTFTTSLGNRTLVNAINTLYASYQALGNSVSTAQSELTRVSNELRAYVIEAVGDGEITGDVEAAIMEFLSVIDGGSFENPGSQILNQRGPDSTYDVTQAKGGSFAFLTESDSVRAVIRDGQDFGLVKDSELATVTEQITSLQSALNALTRKVNDQGIDIAQNAEDIGNSLKRIYTSEDSTYLYSEKNNGELADGPLGPFNGGTGGGGGGGGSDTPVTTNAVLTMKADDARTRTVVTGNAVTFTLTWSSLEDGEETGYGDYRVYVNGVSVANASVAQGQFTTRDVQKYLKSGRNSIRVRMMDVYNQTFEVVYTVNVVKVTLTSTFSDTTVRTGAFTVPFVANGQDCIKICHAIIDDDVEHEIVMEVEEDGVLKYFNIPAQSHGTHTLEMYATADVNDTIVTTEHLHYEFIATVAGNQNPVIQIFGEEPTAIGQYDTLRFDYAVYDPTSMNVDVVITVNGTQTFSGGINRTKQNFEYPVRESNNLTIVITVGDNDASRTLNVAVTESIIDITPVTESLVAHFTAVGRNNNEQNAMQWNGGTGIYMQLEGFTKGGDLWQKDSDGNTSLRLLPGRVATMKGYRPFAQDFRETGMTINIKFKVTDVFDYDAEICNCLKGGRGINITAETAYFASAQTHVDASFGEGMIIDLSYTVAPRTATKRYIYEYINGIRSRKLEYPENDDFAQLDGGIDLSFAPTGCTVDLYSIRIYNTELNQDQIVDNWIYDTEDVELMLYRYEKNNILNANGDIDIDKVWDELPVFYFQSTKMSEDKTEKIPCTGFLRDKKNALRNFDFEGAQHYVQGTSSVQFTVKNFKFKFKGGFLVNGTNKGTWAMSENAIPTNLFCLKANVASSENANNTVLAQLYEDINPYRTPRQLENPKLRTTVEGFPIAVFWNNGERTQFAGIFTFNNDKGTAETYTDDGEQAWEFKENNAELCLFQTDNMNQFWDKFEVRFDPEDYPEMSDDPTDFQEVIRFIASTDQSQATGDPLGSTVTYGGVSFTNDTAEYRLAKFKDGIWKRCEKTSFLFYYFFTDLFCLMDSRAKNQFFMQAGSAMTI